MHSRFLSFFNLNDIFELPVANEKKSKRILTNWIVLTGTGSTGKTTLINALKQHFGEEVRFIHIDEEFRHHLAVIKRDMTDEQYAKYLVSQEAFDVALKMRLEIESKLDPNTYCVLDRSLIDTLAYGIEFGNTLSEAQRALVKRHLSKYAYKEVYHLGLLPLENDGCRLLSSEMERKKSQTIFFNQYLNAGYLPIRVGQLSDEKIKSIKLRVGIVASGIQKPIHKIKFRHEV